ncbi:MAG: glutamate--tRNA ligase [Bacilli bacterium]|nr:glutamate--tRNA ligase [Bacilli bacterium]
MNNNDLANLLYPNITKTIADLEKEFKDRKLWDGSKVTRFAPSPTGRVHMGNLYASFIPEVIARESNGVFILRIEDTDSKRAIANGVELILEDLKHYDYKIDEDPISGGNYGPYIQTKRKEIYHIVAKYLVSIGRAYPCFCKEDELDELRDKQKRRKERIGYYGKYAKCRKLSYEEIKNKIENGESWVLRLKSNGDFNKTIIFNDLVKGRIELPENDIDQVLVKSDGIPPYALAHVCDDHFMRVTTVTRDDSYISSVPFHLELWDACGFKAPEFAHLLPLNIKDGETIRKISKRKDPEAAVSFYHKRGIPVEAVKLYFASIMNSNFEEWFLLNPTKSYKEFHFTFDKMSKSGPIFDLNKLINISKNYLSRLTAKEVYSNLLEWAKEYDKDFYDLIYKYKDYTISILNIEREVEKPRKDFSSYSEIKDYIWYMYDELFFDENFNARYDFIRNNDDMNLIVKEYFNIYYDINDDKDTWFEKMKKACEDFGYSSSVKEYKKDPSKYKGSIIDFSMAIRVGVTSKIATPDLYEILRLLGTNKIIKRVNYIK